MMDDKDIRGHGHTILNEEQEAVLDMYLANLDNFLATIQESENVQVETETLHLKKILTKS